MKGSPPTDLVQIDRYDGGVGWLAYPEEAMERAGHAVARDDGDDGVWLLDPVDAAGLDDLLADLGEVAGVVLCLDRHRRDAGPIARRHDVAVHVPKWMSDVADEVDAPVERYDETVAGFDATQLFDLPVWQEAVLYDGETLYVPEALGTGSLFLAPGEDLGVHPLLRVSPPTALDSFDPERLLVGHGEGIHEDPGARIRRALDAARANAPALYLKTLGRLTPL